MNIPLALRLVKCGLAKFTLIGEDSGLCGFDCNGWEVELEVGDTTDYERIRYQCVQTNDGPRLLPDTSDSLLIGYVLAECRKHWPKLGTWYAPSRFEWMAGFGAQRWQAETELEALVAVWEAALAAGKGAS
jgi:hypothetical protein